LIVWCSFVGVSLVSGTSVSELSIDNFDDLVVKSKEPYLIEYFSSKCGSCNQFSPTWDKLVGRQQTGHLKFGRVQIDTAEGMQLAQRQGIMSRGIPAVQLHAGEASELLMAGNLETLQGLEQKMTDALKRHHAGELGRSVPQAPTATTATAANTSGTKQTESKADKWKKKASEKRQKKGSGRAAASAPKRSTIPGHTTDATSVSGAQTAESKADKWKKKAAEKREKRGAASAGHASGDASGNCAVEPIERKDCVKHDSESCKQAGCCWVPTQAKCGNRPCPWCFRTVGHDEL